MSKKRFEGKVVLITGASTGIGKATAFDFVREVAKLALATRSKNKLDRVAEEIKRYTDEVLVVPTVVSKPDQVTEKVSEVINRFGRIDYLFDNAVSSNVRNVEEDDFIDNVKKKFEVDFLGTLYVTKSVLPYMSNQGSGHIMNMSSVVGKKAYPRFRGYSSLLHAMPSDFTRMPKAVSKVFEVKFKELAGHSLKNWHVLFSLK